MAKRAWSEAYRPAHRLSDAQRHVRGRLTLLDAARRRLPPSLRSWSADEDARVAANRVPWAKVVRGLAPICGRCKAPLPSDLKPMTVTDATFSSDVERSPLPVLLDMWAPWCGPCRMIAPIVEELAAEMSGPVRVGKLNVDENPATAARFGVQSIPTLLVLKQGREVDRIVGVQSKSEIVRHLERVVD